MRYVGVDAHKRTSHLTMVDELGHVVRRRQIQTSRAAFHSALGQDEEPFRAVLEASFGWGPVYDWLDELAEEVVLAHPLKVRAIAEARIKTDAIDSETLAHLLRADLIPAAHACSSETRAFKRVLRQRLFLVRIRTMLKNRVHALLSQYSLQRPDVTDLYGKAGRAWLQALSLPHPDQELLREDVELIALLGDRIRSTDRLIAELARGDAVVGWIRSMPGIGEFFSVLIRWEVDEMSRFRTPKKFASYTGLVPSTYASGSRVRHGRLTKQGNKWLRWTFVEAVTPAIRTSPWLRGYYDRIKTRRGAKDARTATARKLAEVAWAVWTEGRAYEDR